MKITSKKDYKFFLEADLKALNIVPSLKNKLAHDIWAFQKKLRKLEYYINCKRSPLGKLFIVYLRLDL